jgi:hypothetical protein
MDLFDLLAAHRVLVAQQLDEGKITEAEAEVMEREVHTRVKSEAARRDSASSTAAAAQQAATSAFFQSHRSPRLMCMDLGGILHCQ